MIKQFFDGLTPVIFPLIPMMIDQVSQLAQFGVEKCGNGLAHVVRVDFVVFNKVKTSSDEH